MYSNLDFSHLSMKMHAVVEAYANISHSLCEEDVSE